MPAFGSFTPEQRAAAAASAARARRERAELLAALKAGRVSLAAALGDERARRLRAGQLVRALPGVGQVKAAAALTAAGIEPDRRVGQLGARQRAALIDRLGAR